MFVTVRFGVHTTVTRPKKKSLQNMFSMFGLVRLGLANGKLQTALKKSLSLHDYPTIEYVRFASENEKG